MTYSTVRFGVYEEVKRGTGPSSSYPSLAIMAIVSGFIGGLVGNFADIVNVRMQHDKTQTSQHRLQYKNAFDGVARIAREEGVSNLFRGWLPGSIRASVMTLSQLACYDLTKNMIMAHTVLEDTFVTHVFASFLAGAVAATASSPVDVIKTRMMTGPQQQSVFDTVQNVSKQEGIAWVIRGWGASFLRLGP